MPSIKYGVALMVFALYILLVAGISYLQEKPKEGFVVYLENNIESLCAGAFVIAFFVSIGVIFS